MPLELGVWRIDNGVQPVEFGRLELESQLEDILEQNIEIASPGWMVVGRQVRTAYDKNIDFLALDSAGNVIALELKRDKTYRDIVAQLLDYGSWVRDLRNDDIAQIFSDYLKKYLPNEDQSSIDEAFCKKFQVKEMPEELNDSHQLVIVASDLDPSTERVVRYLAEEYGVSINAIFFRVFRDGERQYLSRAWLKEPTFEDTPKPDRSKADWNGEYYVSFGGSEGRDWEEAVKFGFISGGGGSWYTKTLHLLEPGARIWVNVPGTGYVGVGEVEEAVVPVDEFLVSDGGESQVSLVTVAKRAALMTRAADDPEKAEHLVRVKWIKTHSIDNPIRETGFFGNQNTVAKPTSQKWVHTVERLKKRFGVT